MLNLAAAKVFLCVEPTDMRKSYDTLALVVRDHLQGDPLSGSWFVFRGKRRDRLKILYWDGDGYAIWQKRLEVGTFELPKVTGAVSNVEIRASDLALILSGIDLAAKRRKRYLRPAPTNAQ
jgi:transposase